jgi:hypothetical protein
MLMVLYYYTNFDIIKIKSEYNFMKKYLKKFTD